MENVRGLLYDSGMASRITSFPKDQIKVLLLENIHQLAHDMFRSEGYQVEALSTALGEEALAERIKDVHILGIRSKTQVTEAVLARANRLLTIGAFCIGTNQIDLKGSKSRGIACFNAPFGNTRSVAEMVLAEIVMLARRLGQRSNEMHQGIWRKVSADCHEVRGKTLGIVGYGNIGTQVGTLAEHFGIRVIFYDIVSKLPHGNTRGCNTLAEVLKNSDFLTLHVPATPSTKWMIGAKELEQMKKGSHLINASRGSVVVIPALVEALKSGHLAGAAIDVFPEEPESNINDYQTPLQGLENVILTPHIGGATEEAQANIGEEVPTSLIRYINSGSTLRSVNLPEVNLAPTGETHRILNIHKNVPGVLSEINRIVAGLGANIQAQALATDADVGYLVLDTDRAVSNEVKSAIEALKTSIRTRILY
jgi:D-3-phosphoglycerate dehydrogenase